MFRISGIGGGSYRVNPAFERRAQEYQKISKEYESLEKLIKSGKADPEDLERFAEVEKEKQIAEQNCNVVPQVIEGGNLNKDSAIAEANGLCKIDYYC